MPRRMEDRARDEQCLRRAVELLREARCVLDAPYCNGELVGPDGDLARQIDAFLASERKRGE